MQCLYHLDPSNRRLRQLQRRRPNLHHHQHGHVVLRRAIPRHHLRVSPDPSTHVPTIIRRLPTLPRQEQRIALAHAAHPHPHVASRIPRRCTRKHRGFCATAHQHDAITGIVHASDAHGRGIEQAVRAVDCDGGDQSAGVECGRKGWSWRYDSCVILWHRMAFIIYRGYDFMIDLYTNCFLAIEHRLMYPNCTNLNLQLAVLALRIAYKCIDPYFRAH